MESRHHTSGYGRTGVLGLTGCVPMLLWEVILTCSSGHERMAVGLLMGCGWNEGVCLYAAQRGHFELLKWARANGCDWDRDTCSEAARGGQLEILQWALDNGCPWDYRGWSYAAEKGHLHILRWILKRRLERE
jgi:hypothetical protein